ncbi:hypothetical protein [Alkanindiges illinoisensis]|uniref:hypothetical protein n=1 Tax=Alkanindiges illinoisensis TaxID=197183 RepID=UPI0004789406|nr:hypothetical protein [Alkanindiges illinoisensis]
MTLPQYYRTPKGNQALENRSVKLTSRQRALLLMIENGNASHLSQQQLRQLATTDNLAVLLEHQLIAAPETSKFPETSTPLETIAQAIPTTFHSEIQPVAPTHFEAGAPQHQQVVTENQVAQPASAIALQTHQALAAPEPMPDLIPSLAGQDIVISTDLHSAAMLQSTPVYLSFDDVKQLMMNSLREYCGLLASALIKDIQHASSITKLRMCQMRWVTTLTETRAPSAQIKRWIEQINDSLNHVGESPASSPEALTL